MPYIKGSVTERIEQKRNESPEFRKAWYSSREEYRLIGEMISLCRKRENDTDTTCRIEQ